MIETTIRRVTVADAGGVAVLVTELGYSTGPREMSERLAGLLSDASYFAFVAERGGPPVGLAGGRIGQYFEKNGLYAQLVVFVVSTKVQRTGVGTALLDAVERCAIARGAQEIIVNSGSHRVDEVARSIIGNGVPFDRAAQQANGADAPLIAKARGSFADG